MCQTKTGDIFKEIGRKVSFVGEKVGEGNSIKWLVSSIKNFKGEFGLVCNHQCWEEIK
ncbi:hypothetical protein SAMN05421821_11925 [Mucilaginibacter lappiensis]|uniref:Uncharacterized protein n=1 Tax=Mucilaginibacter lappiensis TaxID=354630 RepID=A0ABR6PS93_9SPHI|nr:hypothetical protein [Mucilaginibacter lappiensis]SIS02327.1 hypothetical protein SAMN05421821_11925 [Mucilaginibacter lappiensis]